ncbi:magnesium and cobalt transport protein CorA [Streptomyces sp. NRRL B-1347]|uniref:magnesium and cobalt transport protein CorA n=1 Tax=Streptomyces sp. NRRL B-1347 TaxID=1476877 RepID=UPI00099CC399|nr:magnesium and cobalt transport protein CorA [Streptomyces sp. NRRL B-1347]
MTPERRAHSPRPQSTRKHSWRRAAERRTPEGSATPTPSAAEPPRRRPQRRTAPQAPSVVQAALYRDGIRVSSPTTLAETYRELRTRPDGMAWIGLARPTEAELLSLAAEFDLHELAVEDAMEAHQRPKLERYGDTLFVVLRAARYLDAPEEVDFGELHVFVGPDFVITVRHGAAPDLSAVRHRMEDDPELLRLGPEAVLYAILDAVVDGYAPVVAGVQNDIDEIETEVFSGAPEVSRRIYELAREMVEFQRATRPLVGMLHALMAGFAKYGTDEELQRYLRDVADHVTHTSERVDGFRQALADILTVNATLVTQQELGWGLGYPFAILLMAVVCVSLYFIFKRRDWL